MSGAHSSCARYRSTIEKLTDQGAARVVTAGVGAGRLLDELWATAGGFGVMGRLCATRVQSPSVVIPTFLNSSMKGLSRDV
jgi:hypothetical protein